MVAKAAVTSTNTSRMRMELRDLKPMYDVIDDCLAGSIAVKKRTTRYLPKPNAADKSAENVARYAAYLTRAVFYNVARRTLEGFIGELFDTDPVVTLPSSMEAIQEDATGDGVGLTQMVKTVAGLVLSLGRAGMLADYPNVGDKVTTKADLDTGGIRPVIKYYHPLRILNWRYKKVGALRKLSLVVLEEDYERESTIFEVKNGKRWRVLRLNEQNQYTIEIYRDDTGTQIVDEDGNASVVIYPKKHDGTFFDTIPFTFVGAKNNDANIDYPPLYDLCDLNLAHYRNSADYEEAVYLCGQPTLVLSGLTQDWVDLYFKDGVPLGSRASISLPTGATADLLQVTETTMTKEAMEQKERQMVALGAKLVEQTTVQRTASEASIEVASEMSVLSNVSGNVSIAVENMLWFCGEFLGVDKSAIQYLLNKEFSVSFADPISRTEVVAAWVSGAISFTEMRAALRKGGVATLDDEKAREEMKTDLGNGDGPTVPGAGGFDADGNPIDNAAPGTEDNKKTPAKKTKAPAAKSTGD